MQLRAYRQYVHTLAAAYRQYGQPDDGIRGTVPSLDALRQLPPGEQVAVLAAAGRERLGTLNATLAEGLLAEPRLRWLQFEDVSLAIPIINQQGEEWYGAAPPSNFDFMIERRLGLLDDARVVYDFGGHHGVWAAYYAKVVGSGGFVYSFEPSIINVEVSALLFLVNGIDNVVNIATAVGTSTDLDGSGDSSTGMLVDFVDQMRVIDVRALTWRHADFMKMDIEGFEYDLLTRFPWLFDIANHIHLELHIPHLERRGLDYRDVLRVLPFEQFEILKTEGDALHPVDHDTPLSGYCSLMMRRR